MSATSSELPSGTVAFLFSDVEGSTQLLRTIGDDYARLIEAHHALLQEAFEAHSGRVVDSQADSFFVAFPRVRDAAAAAAQAQRTLAAHEWPHGAEVRVRMGLHAGEPLVTEERYVGLGVHRAARICAVAHGGQVLVSQAAASLLVDNEPAGVSLRELGEHELRDFERPEQLSQLVVEGLPSDFPPVQAARPGKTRHGREFGILGPLEVVGESGAIALGGQKQRALLGLLLMRVGEVVATDRLVDQLWGEHPPRTATTALQNHVSQLRKLLGADVLLTKPPGYVLQVATESVDLGRFERLLAEAKGAEPAERAAKLREALALWRGPPLADLAFETFAQSEIRRLEELRLDAIEERIEADLELGEGPALVAELEALMERFPLRERLRGQLMLALYRSGRQAEALDVYHAGRTALSEELGIDPGPALQQLYGSILRQESVLVASPAVRPVEDHYAEVVKALLAGRLVPVLGSDANLSAAEGQGIPGLDDIAAYLAESFDYSPTHRELARVSEYVALMKGVGPLYDELHDLLDRDYDPGPVHRSLAEVATVLGKRGAPRQLIVTTNFDLALERAFSEAEETLDVVYYISLGRHHGRFLHVTADGDAVVVEVPNAYTGLSLSDRTVILKLLGQVDREPGRRWESFVVTEDDHIDYLAQADISSLVPVTLVARLRRSHFLFLGYPLRDWGLRVFLHRIWGREKVAYRSWAVEASIEPVEQELWRQRGVDVFDIPLEEYVGELASRVAEAVR